MVDVRDEHGRLRVGLDLDQFDADGIELLGPHHPTESIVYAVRAKRRGGGDQRRRRQMRRLLVDGAVVHFVNGSGDCAVGIVGIAGVDRLDQVSATIIVIAVRATVLFGRL